MLDEVGAHEVADLGVLAVEERRQRRYVDLGLHVDGPVGAALRTGVGVGGGAVAVAVPVPVSDPASGPVSGAAVSVAMGDRLLASRTAQGRA